MLQFEVNVALSEEDDRQRVRQEIVRSFIYGERAYVALLNSLVQVTIHILRCVIDDGAGVKRPCTGRGIPFTWCSWSVKEG